MKRISIIVVARNSEAVIDKAINSILNQTIPKYLCEIIIVDGLSSDNTLSVARSILADYQDDYSKIYFEKNEGLILSSGWNIGIQRSSGDFIIRIDAHSALPNNYIESLLYNYSNQKVPENCVGIGGGLVSKARKDTYVNRQIVNLVTSRFGTGGSPFRGQIKSELFESDTAVFALYKSHIFEKVTGFNIHLERCQDIEFHSRVHDQGMVLFTDSTLIINHYPESRLLPFLKKAFQTGKWVNFTGKGRLRHGIPVLFAIYLMLIPLFLVMGQCYILIPLLVYGSLGFYFITIEKHDVSLILFYLMYHFSYGIGGLYGRILSVYKKVFNKC